MYSVTRALLHLALLTLPSAAFACNEYTVGNLPYGVLSVEANHFFAGDKYGSFVTASNKAAADYMDKNYGKDGWTIDAEGKSIRIYHDWPAKEEAPDILDIDFWAINRSAGRQEIELIIDSGTPLQITRPNVITRVALLETEVGARHDGFPRTRFRFYIEDPRALYHTNVIRVWAIRRTQDGMTLLSQPISFLRSYCGGWGAHRYFERKSGPNVSRSNGAK